MPLSVHLPDGPVLKLLCWRLVSTGNTHGPGCHKDLTAGMSGEVTVCNLKFLKLHWAPSSSSVKLRSGLCVRTRRD